MEEYLGFKEIVLSDTEINSVFQNDTENIFGCIPNQYLIAKDGCDSVVELMRCTGDRMVKVPYKTINSRFLGKVKPRNIQQQLAIDMLYNNDITVKVIAGRFGSGKLSCPHGQ